MPPSRPGRTSSAEEIPLGSNRVYAKVERPVTYASWLAAVKAGRGFVTNGPILEFKAGDAEPGDVVEFQGTQRIKARVTARSILPFTTLEIVRNGDPVGHKTLPIPKNAPKDGVYSMEVEATVELTRSGWLTARVVDHPDLKNRILPRDVSVFAAHGPDLLPPGRPQGPRGGLHRVPSQVRQGSAALARYEPAFLQR